MTTHKDICNLRVWNGIDTDGYEFTYAQYKDRNGKGCAASFVGHYSKDQVEAKLISFKRQTRKKL